MNRSEIFLRSARGLPWMASVVVFAVLLLLFSPQAAAERTNTSGANGAASDSVAAEAIWTDAGLLVTVDGLAESAPIGNIGAIENESPVDSEPVLAEAASVTVSLSEQTSGSFNVIEATIGQIHSALDAGDITCRELVKTYILRISTYDKSGPAFNSIITINPDALRLAQAIDNANRPRSEWGELYCIPVIIKDLMHTADRMPTTGGNLSLNGMLTPDDATIVARMRDAGAIILAKANLDEMARGIWGASGLGGQTRNAYDLSVNPSGSSAGTGVSIAANFGAVGIGTDTCGSIRNPSAFGSLVGLRPTYGLNSNAGIIPDAPSSDTVGPMARTVRDAAILLSVIAGPDLNDPVTARAPGQVPGAYTASLRTNGLQGARIGVIRKFFGAGEEADKVTAVMNTAISDLERLGATVVDPIEILFGDLILSQGDNTWGRWNYENGDALDAYLKSLGVLAPVTYEEMREIGTGAPLIFPFPPTGGTNTPEHLIALWESTAYTQTAILAAMADHNLDALVYPTLSSPPAPIGQFQLGSNCQLSAWSGYPAITVPAGYTVDGHAVGLEMISTPWTEPTLLRFAYAYERGTMRRVPPPLAPALTQ